MKRIVILVLSILCVTAFVGCEEVSHEYNLRHHEITMDTLSTYVIDIESNRQTTIGEELTNSYIYVDNINNTFLVSNYLKDPISAKNADVIYEEINDDIYGLFYNGVWTKYQLSSEYAKLKYIEKVIVDLFDGDTSVKVSNNLYFYRTFATLDDLDGSILDIFAIDFAKDNRSVEFPITAIYSIEESRFISFKLDFNPILDTGDTNYANTTDWSITITFEDFNDNFELSIQDVQQDDFINDFDQNDKLQITRKYCFEMIRGSLDFSLDKDLFKVEFEDDGVFLLKAISLENIDNLYISVLDESRKFIRSFELSKEDDSSNYWSYSKGIYYLQVSGDIGIQNITEYNFLFLGN